MVDPLNNEYIKYGRKIDLEDRDYVVEEALFEGKWYLKLLNKGYTSDYEIFSLIDKKKKNNKRLREKNKVKIDDVF